MVKNNVSKDAQCSETDFVFLSFLFVRLLDNGNRDIFEPDSDVNQWG